MKLYFATENKHKHEELSRIMHPHQIILPKSEGIICSPDENGLDFFSNALIKARYLYDIVKHPVIADDSGLCIDALQGKPGIHSARFGEKNGIQLSTREKNLLVLEMLKNETQRDCQFVCNMILYLSPHRFYSVQETLEGLIIDEAKGEQGFGYDPIVYLPSLNKTVAQLTGTEKDLYSHRGKAGALLKELLAQIFKN